MDWIWLLWCLKFSSCSRQNIGSSLFPQIGLISYPLLLQLQSPGNSSLPLLLEPMDDQDHCFRLLNIWWLWQLTSTHPGLNYHHLSSGPAINSLLLLKSMLAPPLLLLTPKALLLSITCFCICSLNHPSLSVLLSSRLSLVQCIKPCCPSLHWPLSSPTTPSQGLQFSSVQLLSRVRLFVTPWTTARQASLSITNSWSPPNPMSIVSVMPSNHLILCCPFFLLPSIFPSIRVFSNESALHIKWSKYWTFSFNISPSNEHPGLISFRMDWLDLLAVQGTLKSLLQHHSSKASILLHSAFFIVQLSHSYMTTGKTIALTR